MPIAYVGLGANVGDRRRNLQMAIASLDAQLRVTAVSSLYRSRALVLEGAPPGPDYLNAAAAIDAGERSARDLLEIVKRLEHAIGRRPAARWAPRPIDIDILLFGDEVIEGEHLTVPHPRMLERNFVLVPLAEIAGDVAHPLAKSTIAELAEAVDRDGLERLEGPEWARSSRFPGD